MSITQDAAARPAARRSPAFLPAARSASPWWWLVLGAALLLFVVAVVMAAWWAGTSERRDVEFRVTGTLSAVELDAGAGDVVITGSAGGSVVVQRTEAFAFGRPPDVTRAVEDGVLRIGSRCPDTVVGTCSADFRIAVRDNVQVNVRTSSGTVRISNLNGSARIETGSGAIAVDRFCGFQLSATSASGDVRGSTDCSPDRVELRSNSGDVHATVPTGRYRIDANSDRGSVRVRNVVHADDASFAVQAISGTGDVLVDGSR